MKKSKKTGELPFEIVGYTDQQDLRRITNNSTCLRKKAREFGLGRDEAMVFVNNAIDSHRVISNIGGHLGLYLPEKSTGSDKLSMFLQVSESLSGLASIKKVLINLKDVERITIERLERRLALQNKRKANKKSVI